MLTDDLTVIPIYYVNEMYILQPNVKDSGYKPQEHVQLYNEAAARLFGREPRIGEDRYCGAYRLYTPRGEPIPLLSRPETVGDR